MKILSEVAPTPEQLPIISNPTAGVTLIRGAAGSGKTTTAMLMLKQLAVFWKRRNQRLGLDKQVKILVLTFNRTLRGYINELARCQISADTSDIMVLTFGKWAVNALKVEVIDDRECKGTIEHLGRGLSLPPDFVVSEVDYVLGRFLPEKLVDYLECKRVGRGGAPRMDRLTRERLLNEVCLPFQDWKRKTNAMDWLDVATKMICDKVAGKYDVMIVDEAQDFSANQIRAVVAHAADPASMVFVLDAMQRIYPRGCTWKECGIEIPGHRTYRLQENHRNTKQICQFSAAILKGMEVPDDGTIPDLESCKREGILPIVLKGKFSGQCQYVYDYLNKVWTTEGQEDDTVVFLHPLGGKWFDYVREFLKTKKWPHVELSRRSEWPRGKEKIALSTMHSVKGLEFDHVVILGLNEEITKTGRESNDTTFETLRRLLAMSATRARCSVILGYNPDNPSQLISLFGEGTFTLVAI